MIFADVGDTYEAVAEGFATGLTGTLGVRVRDNTGSDTLARTTAGIAEDIAGSGIYRVTLPAISVAGQYTVVWDNGAGVYATEDLLVGVSGAPTVISQPSTITITAGPGPVGSSFKTMQDDVMLDRFKEANRPAIKRWLNYEWGKLWAGYDWKWKVVGPSDLAVTAGGRTPQMPIDFAKVLSLFNELGDELSPLPSSQFDAIYQQLVEDGQTSPSEAFTVVSYQLYLGPTPDASSTFTLTYERRVGFHPGGDTSLFTVGPMVADADVPAFLPAEHCPLIELRAARLGLRLSQDPSWAHLNDEISEAEAFMLNDLMPDVGGEPVQYGRDTYGL
jgi:hypothetical protein